MKNNYNTLHQYILDNSISDYHRETVNGLFRSVLEPVISNQDFEASIALRLISNDGYNTAIKRLSFSNTHIFSFCDTFNDFSNIQKQDIWGTTEFVIVIGARYSACLLWDYSLSDHKDYTPVCCLYNSSIITSITKKIAENSTNDITETLFKYSADRRENMMLNTSINYIISLLNSKNDEVLFSEIEKEQIINSDDERKTASIVADKAKFIAHEIKNNLSVINLYSKIIQKRLEKVSADNETTESLINASENIIKASDNISAHINDLRSMSEPYLTEFDIKESVCSVFEQCGEKAKNANVELILNDIQAKIINSDRVKFECSLMNIIYNAIEACSTGDKVEIDVIYNGNKVSIQIKNNGDKIPQSLQTEIFKPNFTTKEKGNGLGLAFCKRQLQIIGGDINLIYSNDEETLFEITLIV